MYSFERQLVTGSKIRFRKRENQRFLAHGINLPSSVRLVLSGITIRSVRPESVQSSVLEEAVSLVYLEEDHSKMRPCKLQMQNFAIGSIRLKKLDFCEPMMYCILYTRHSYKQRIEKPRNHGRLCCHSVQVETTSSPALFYLREGLLDGPLTGGRAWPARSIS